MKMKYGIMFIFVIALAAGVGVYFTLPTGSTEELPPHAMSTITWHKTDYTKSTKITAILDNGGTITGISAERIAGNMPMSPPTYAIAADGKAADCVLYSPMVYALTFWYKARVTVTYFDGYERTDSYDFIYDLGFTYILPTFEP